MRFNVERSGGFYDGWVDVTLLDDGTHWKVIYKYHARFGRMAKWVGFIGLTFDDQKEMSIEKRLLSEEHLQMSQAFNVSGMAFARSDGNTFNFSKTGVNGKVWFSFDGSDPAEIDRLEAQIGVGPVNGKLTLLRAY